MNPGFSPMDTDAQPERLLSVWLTRYEQAIAALSQPADSPQAVLAALLCRDRVEAALQAQGPTVDELMMLDHLDAQFKAAVGQGREAEALDRWRSLYKPDPSAWWWYPEPVATSPPPPDWLWKSLSIVFLTVSASLILNTAARFWSGGVASAGTWVIATQSILTLAAGRGALTQSGREGWERFLRQRQVPETLWPQRSCAAAGGVLLIVGGLHAALPWFATGYNAWGMQHHENGRLGSAQRDLLTALSLRPDYGEAQFNLGLVYEDLQAVEQAKAAYQFVVARDPEDVPLAVWLQAHNNLARLHILSGAYDRAVPLLIKAMALDLEPGLVETDLEIADVNYALLKNLGWARLAQGRYREAEIELERANEFDEQILEPMAARDGLGNRPRAAAHCLLAQVYDAQGELTWADEAWASCLRYADPGQPDEDNWIGRYEQRQEGAE